MKKLWTIFTVCLLLMLIFAPAAFADGDTPAEAAKIDTGDTAFVLISAALVMIMTPGLALFYGGMVRTKNALSTIMQSFFVIGLISVQWVLFGYSLAFGPDISSFIGGLDWVGLAGVGQEANADYAATIPHLAFMIFQAMFAVITVGLITGAFAERMKFGAFVVFALLWSTFVYDPVAHWVWGVGGWIRELGVLDFAGGTVVHIISGVSGLTIALMIGKRKGYGSEVMMPHHLPMTVIGASLLWFGWFGFNAGSALSANGLAANAFVVTHAAAAAATVSWVLTEWINHGKPTILGAASGCVAGLVAITPAAGFVSLIPAVIIGLVAGIICFLAVAVLKTRLGYDDSLDAFGVHGVGGTWGALATGLFASKAVNPAGADGLFYGNASQLTTQAIGVAASWAVAAIMTFLIIKLIGTFMEVRATSEQEVQGLDITEHGERGYAYQDFLTGSPIGFASSTGISAQETVAKKTTLA
ncbi:ammonium transporter [Sporomusa acidovorans]|uniref:Ammonium transporter n=1 Tax=Sporomusa acidovorans (strain ATCC 49682 / DSM 3132 / Mol) TaxID=1123286 RepID=A0ABZ3JA40_SPOA4|nr:ammonium transporter [Sporomusa acidovorans]OZC21692.1 ammonium transporter NrgA [Sporomusa acidovorans DSM 3132]SDD59930.1 ammonium transporter [Sporomusa acidovorans]